MVSRETELSINIFKYYMALYDTFNSAFFLSLATLTCGGFYFLVNTCYRSKCAEVNLCGILIIKRDVKLENDSQEFIPSRRNSIV